MGELRSVFGREIGQVAVMAPMGAKNRQSFRGAAIGLHGHKGAAGFQFAFKARGLFVRKAERKKGAKVPRKKKK